MRSEEISPVWRVLALAIAAACLNFCARYYVLWVVNAYYHHSEPNYQFWVICTPVFLVSAYLLFVFASGRLAPSPGQSLHQRLLLFASTLAASAHAVVVILMTY